MDAELFEQALRGFRERVDRVPADGWSGASPCADWDARGVVNHVVGELLWVPPLLAGRTIGEVGDQFDGDVLGDDPAAAYAAAADGAIAAAKEPGAREAITHLSFGDFSGADYLAQVGSDVAIHTWDLSRATGQPGALDEGVVAAVHDFLAPQAEDWRAGGAFGPAVEVAPTASAQDRLLGLTGRNPTG